MECVDLTFAHLEVGDYRVEDRMIFERKTLIDLAESIKDGRLFRQAWALATLAEPLRGALILEGTGADLATSAMRREAIQGALITVTLFFGVPILRSMSGEETARLMAYAAGQARTFACGALPRQGRRPKGRRRAQLAVLQSLPGVGSARAERLLASFGSVESVITAGVAQLEAVPGVGRRTARAIRWAVGESVAAYHGKLDDPVL
jgi:ERCC4-type nuclease